MYEVKLYPNNEKALINKLLDDFEKSGNPKYYRDFNIYINKLKEFGLEMNKKFKRDSFKRLEEDMYELRPKDFRIMFTFKDNEFIILNGFLKKGQETPKEEMERARKCIKKIINRWFYYQNL